MGNCCDYPYEQTPGVPKLDTAEHHPARRRRSVATHRLHPKNSHPILRPSDEPLEFPRVGVSGLRPRDSLVVRSPTVTRVPPRLTEMEPSHFVEDAVSLEPKVD
ncbi:hypothetical protein Trydic_g3459 [Trypoxylus dichotomus]